MPSILITRPRESAEPLAAALEQLGYKTIIEPLLTIKSVTTTFRPMVNIDAVMITSGNALSVLEGRRAELNDLFDKPCFCVGPRTAGKAKAFGFRQVQNTDRDGAELAGLISRTLRNATILHLAARDVDSKAQQALEQQGHKVAIWPVYEAIPVKAFTAETCGMIGKQKLDAIVVFSPRTAETLAKLLGDAALEACCAQLTAICLSEPVAAVLKPLNWRRLATASAPAEPAVIACLQETCPIKS